MCSERFAEMCASHLKDLMGKTQKIKISKKIECLSRQTSSFFEIASAILFRCVAVNCVA